MKTINVVAAVIYDVRDEEDVVLATQRGYGKWSGRYDFPGGKTESGESDEQALKRELMEELDLEISVGSLIDTIDFDYPEFHLHMNCYRCRITGGTLTLKEHLDAKWLRKDELHTVTWLPADMLLLDKIL